jgi:hypothetical protein
MVLALGTGQLDHRVAGKMLYALQHATSLIKYRARIASNATRNDARREKSKAISTLQHSHAGISGFEKEFGINPGPTSMPRPTGPCARPTRKWSPPHQ